jgi:hypothetical protein
MRACPMGTAAAPAQNAAMTTAAPSTASSTAADWHRRQREMVAASLRCVPGASRPTHRRWA